MAVTYRNKYWFTEQQLLKILNRITVQDSGCWWHPSKPTTRGYASTRIGWPIQKTMLIHHLTWIYYKGDIPDQMVLDHLCHDPAICKKGNDCQHRRCVNPEHLKLVTRSENGQRTSKSHKFYTHCKNGHSVDNYFQSISGKNYCAACQKANGKRNYLRHKNNPAFKARRAEVQRNLRAKKKVGV